MKSFNWTAGGYFLAIAVIIDAYGCFLFLTGQLTRNVAFLLAIISTIWLIAYVIVGVLVGHWDAQREDTMGSWLESLPDPVGDATRATQDAVFDIEATADPASILRWGYEGEQESGRG